MRRVTKKRLLLAIIMCKEEAVRFAHEFNTWDVARNNLKKLELCQNFKDVEFEKEKLEKQYKASVYGACRALFALDKKYMRLEGQHIVIQLVTFEEKEAALFDIDKMLNA